MTASAHEKRPHSEHSLDSDNIRTNPSIDPTPAKSIVRRFGRRALLRGTGFQPELDAANLSPSVVVITKDDGGEIGS